MISGRLVVGGMLLAVIALFASSYIPAKVFLLDPLNDWQKIAEIEKKHRPSFVLKDVKKPYSEAIKLWTAKFKEDPRNRIALQNIAGNLISLARLSGDESHFREAESLLSSNLELELNGKCSLEAQFARTLLTRHGFADALAIANRLEEKCPNSGEVMGLKADAAMGYGQYTTAEEYAHKLFDVKKPNSSAKIRVAELALAKGDSNRAISLLSEVMKSIPGSSFEASIWIRLRIGIVYLKANKLDAAQYFFRASLALAPKYYLGLEHLAEVMEERQNWIEAKKLLLEAIGENEVAELYLRLAKVEDTLGNKQAGAAAHQRGVEMLKTASLDPAHVRDYAEFLIENQQNLPEAKKLLETDLSIRPGDRKTNLLMAKVFRLLDDKSQAVEYLNRAASAFLSDEIVQEQKMVDRMS